MLFCLPTDLVLYTWTKEKFFGLVLMIWTIIFIYLGFFLNTWTWYTYQINIIVYEHYLNTINCILNKFHVQNQILNLWISKKIWTQSRTLLLRLEKINTGFGRFISYTQVPIGNSSGGGQNFDNKYIATFNKRFSKKLSLYGALKLAMFTLVLQLFNAYFRIAYANFSMLK